MWVLWALLGLFVAVWFVVGMVLLYEEDNAFAWPYYAIKFLINQLPGFKTRSLAKEAYRLGAYDMKNYGSVHSPERGRRRKEFMGHKNERIYDAYIQGGHDVLAQEAEEEAGISLAQLRQISLKKSDEARLVQIEAMKQARQEALAAPTDKWQTEFERITK